MVADHKQDVHKNIPQWTRDAERANATQVSTMLRDTNEKLRNHLDMAEQARSTEKQEQGKGQQRPQQQ